LIIQWLKSGNGNPDFDKCIEVVGRIGGEKAALYLAELIVDGRYYDKIIDALKRIDKIPVLYLLSEYKNNNRFRRTGAETLATILDIDALQALLEGIQDRYREVRKNAELGLTHLGVLAVEQLAELLNLTNDEDVKLLICRILGKVGDRRALIHLEEITQSKNRYLHFAAIEAICKIKDPLSVHILSKWIESPDRYTRKLVVKGLGQQYYTEAVETLIKRVDDEDLKVRLEVLHRFIT
jgi:HEAT repeat protein